MGNNAEERMCRYSIVIPVYNVKPDYLRKCVESILQDPADDLDVIIVDDKSANGCDVVCDEYGASDKRVRVLHQPKNRGVSEARNLGIRESYGEWIVFVDSDDWLESGSLQRISKYISADTDVIIFSAVCESMNSKFRYGVSDGVVVYTENQLDHNIRELRDKMLKQDLISTHPMFDTVKYCWGKAFRREFLTENEINFPNLNYCEDIVFMCRVFQKASKIVQIPEYLYHYRMTENSAVNSYRPNAMTEQKAFVSLMQEVGKDTDIIYYAALLSMQVCLIRYFYHKENKRNIINKHTEAKNFFAEYPYSEVFEHVKCSEMKRTERVKALLIKNKLYYLYYMGTNIRKIKVVRYH